MTPDDTLPPLPEGAHHVRVGDCRYRECFTADQMRAYAAAARAQALEQAAAIKTFPVGISGLEAGSLAGKAYAQGMEHYRLAIKAMPR